MKNMKKIILLFIMVLTYAARAQDFQNVTVRGLGCPDGTASVTYAPDNKTFSIIFDDFMAKLPSASTQRDNVDAISNGLISGQYAHSSQVNIKVCNIGLLLNLPQNTRTATIQISYDYRGFMSLALGQTAFFRSMLFQTSQINHQGGQGHTRNLIQDNTYNSGSNTLDQDLMVSSTKTISIPSVPKVQIINGQRVIKNQVVLAFKNVIGIHATVPNAVTTGDGQIMIDSADIAGKMTIKVLPGR